MSVDEALPPVLSILTLEDCFNYLSERRLELRCGYGIAEDSQGVSLPGGRQWWAKLLSRHGGEVLAVGATLLSAIKAAITTWETR